MFISATLDGERFSRSWCCGEYLNIHIFVRNCRYSNTETVGIRIPKLLFENSNVKFVEQIKNQFAVGL